MQEPMIYMKRKTQIMKEVHKTAEEDPSRNSERTDGKQHWRKWIEENWKLKRQSSQIPCCILLGQSGPRRMQF